MPLSGNFHKFSGQIFVHFNLVSFHDEMTPYLVLYKCNFISLLILVTYYSKNCTSVLDSQEPRREESDKQLGLNLLFQTKNVLKMFVVLEF